jgi:ClpX C4-type zinc finger
VEEANDPPGDHAYVYAATDEEAYLEAGADEKPAMDARPPDLASIICQFCGKSAEQVPRLFAAPRPVQDPTTFATIAVVWICNECVGSLAEALAQEPSGTRFLSLG